MVALAGITAVRPTATTLTVNGVLGATISAGQPVYLDSADSKYKLCDSNVSAAIAEVKGIAMTPGVLDGYGLIATGGSVVLVGTTMAVGETYYVGAVAGTIVPDADLVALDYISRLGTASAATTLLLAVSATGIIHA